MSRKTCSVEHVKNQVNISLKNSSDSYCPKAQRQGMMNVLEMILHESGNYRGFRYLLLHEVPEAALPGMVVNGTVENTPFEVRFAEGTVDKTRVEYF